MGRLTKINEDACQFCRTWAICSEEESCFLYKVYEKLSDYEDMEEQGYKMVNIDKVVELLEERKQEEGNVTLTKIAYNTAIEDAIEIVKSGGKE